MPIRHTLKWTNLLTQEFNSQAELAQYLRLPNKLYSSFKSVNSKLLLARNFSIQVVLPKYTLLSQIFPCFKILLENGNQNLKLIDKILNNQFKYKHLTDKYLSFTLNQVSFGKLKGPKCFGNFCRFVSNLRFNGFRFNL